MRGFVYFSCYWFNNNNKNTVISVSTNMEIK